MKLQTFQTIAGEQEYLQYLKKWDSCTKCPLGFDARTHVHFRGTLPCKVVFVGEGPGSSEDVAGIPFAPKAPAGSILSHLLQHRSDWAIINLVACFPFEVKRVKRVPRRPSVAEVAACTERVADILALLKPDAVVLMGETSRSLFPKPLRSVYRLYKMAHPAFVHRQGGVSTLAYCQCEDVIDEVYNALEALHERGGKAGTKRDNHPRCPQAFNAAHDLGSKSGSGRGH